MSHKIYYIFHAKWSLIAGTPVHPHRNGQERRLGREEFQPRDHAQHILRPGVPRHHTLPAAQLQRPGNVKVSAPRPFPKNYTRYVYSRRRSLTPSRVRAILIGRSIASEPTCQKREGDTKERGQSFIYRKTHTCTYRQLWGLFLSSFFPVCTTTEPRIFFALSLPPSPPDGINNSLACAYVGYSRALFRSTLENTRSEMAEASSLSCSYWLDFYALFLGLMGGG